MYSSGNTDKGVEKLHKMAIDPETGQPNYCPISLLSANGDEGAGSEPVEKVELFGEDGFVLRNLLSDTECEDVIRQAEALGMFAAPETHRMRLCDRVKVMDEDLAAVLFRRALPHLANIQVQDFERPRGTPRDVMRGLWKPSHLNPCFRVCRYDTGGFFLPHHDGDFVESSKRRSLKTFMIYLNDEFDGGPTNFYDESQQHYAKADPEKRLLSYQPVRGSCLVFNHDITHDGGELRDGHKYILRTEVLYEHHYFDDSESVAATFLQKVSIPETKECCFGINNTVSALDKGAVDTLIIWEELDILRLVVKNPDLSNDVSVKFCPQQQALSSRSFFDPGTGTNLDIIESERFVDWLKKLTVGTTTFGEWTLDVRIAFISGQSKAGKQFIQGFGGIGALLSHPMSFEDFEDTIANEPDSDEDFA